MMMSCSSCPSALLVDADFLFKPENVFAKETSLVKTWLSSAHSVRYSIAKRRDLFIWANIHRLAHGDI